MIAIHCLTVDLLMDAIYAAMNAFASMTKRSGVALINNMHSYLQHLVDWPPASNGLGVHVPAIPVSHQARSHNDRLDIAKSVFQLYVNTEVKARRDLH
jgi:hypothetical protein